MVQWRCSSSSSSSRREKAESGRGKREGFYYLLIATSRDGLNALESLYLLLQKASSPRQSVGQSGGGSRQVQQRCSVHVPWMDAAVRSAHSLPLPCQLQMGEAKIWNAFFFLLLAEADTHPAHTASARWRSVPTPATGTETRKRCKAVVVVV